jgi:hypothetical protein
MTSAGRATWASRYTDQRRMRGPHAGTVTLGRSLDWSGAGTYDLDDGGHLDTPLRSAVSQDGAVTFASDKPGSAT